LAKDCPHLAKGTTHAPRHSLIIGDYWMGITWFFPFVREMIFSIKVFVTLLDYLKIPQVTILGDLHV
jgi:hypothetical protein